MEKQKQNGGLSNASMMIGIIAMLFALSPLISAWFMIITWINYLLVPVSIICGVAAIVKSQNLIKSIIGILLSILAICIPLILAEYFLENAVEAAGSTLDFINELENLR